MIIFDEFDSAKAAAFFYDNDKDVDNRCRKVTDSILEDAEFAGIDVVEVIGLLSTMGRTDIVAEVLDELNIRCIDFNTDMKL